MKQPRPVPIILSLAAEVSQASWLSEIEVI